MHRSLGWKPPDVSRIAGVLRITLVALLLSFSALAAWGDELPTLLERLEHRFVVYTLSDGYALLPRADQDADLLEVRAGVVRAAGEVLEREALLARVGDADRVAVEALAALTADPETLAAQRESGSPAGEPADAKKAEAPSPTELARIEPKRVERPRARRETRSSRHRGERVRFFRDIRIDDDESVREALAFVGDVIVGGTVRGDAVAVAGSVRVDGEVGGSVTAVGGSVSLTSDAEVGGDVVAIGGEVRRARGAVVRGDIDEVGVLPRIRWDPDWSPNWPQLQLWRLRHYGPGVGERLLNACLLMVVTLTLLLLARGPMARLERRVRQTPLRAAAAGLAIQIVSLPLLAIVSVVLLVSIVGIPLLLLVPVVVLAMLLAAVIGYAGAAAVCGRLLCVLLGRTGDGPLVVAVLGVATIQAASIMGEVFDGWFLPFNLLGAMLLAIGFAVRYAAWTVGLGALVLAAFGRRLPPPRGV